jgi:serine protease Do
MLVCLGFATEAFGQDIEQPWLEGTSHKKSELDAPLRGSSIAELAERVSPTVVNVIVGYASANKLGGFFESTPFQSPTSAQGSGFIIHPTGYVLTNHHVVEGAESLKVRLWDDREYEVAVIGVDPETDVALLKMRSDAEVKFPAAVLGDSDGVRVGENVLAIGNPLGLSHTVTAGIVSALERRDLAPEGRQVYSEFIQTDASINPGNSGGPLINLYGEVIGINTAINRQGQGIGFAIPINIVKTLIPHLSRHGYVVRTWLGIRMQEVTLPLAKSFGLDRPQGALVTEVIESGPAEASGIVAGDVILEFNGRVIRKSDMLPWLASTAGAEEPVDVVVLRGGKRVVLKVQLEEQPNQSPPELPSGGSSKSETPKSDEPVDLGVGVKTLGKSLARQLGAKDANGVVVTEIDEQSPAKDSGLRRRDVILEVDDSAISSSREFENAVETVKPGEILRFKVIRAGRVVYIAFER